MAQIGNHPPQAQLQHLGLRNEFNVSDRYKVENGEIVVEGLLSKVANFFKSFTESGRASIAQNNQAVLEKIIGRETAGLPPEFVQNIRERFVGMDTALGPNASKMLNGEQLRQFTVALKGSSREVNDRFIHTHAHFRDPENTASPAEKIILCVASSMVQPSEKEGETAAILLTPAQIEFTSNLVMQSILAVVDPIPQDFSGANNILADIRTGFVRVGDKESVASTQAVIDLCENVILKIQAHHATHNSTMNESASDDLNIPQLTQELRDVHIQDLTQEKPDGTLSDKAMLYQSLGLNVQKNISSS